MAVPMQTLLDSLVESARPLAPKGTLASYIPELALCNSRHVAAAVVALDGNEYVAGDASVSFTMQSISKIISLMVALEECGEEKVFSKVGKEPTGDPFNSIVRLETYRIRKPLNPMINAGAIAISALIPGANLDERQQKLLSFVREVTGNSQVFADLAVCNSENATGFRNRSLAWFLKDLGVIDSDVEEALSLYFWQCSMSITVLDLARIAAFLANDGIVPHSGKRLVSVRTAKIVKGLMFTCGLYDGSGEFGVEAGIPAKSGVGGGILAASPGRLGIGVFGPALDERGNSVAGIHMLGALARELNLSVL